MSSDLLKTITVSLASSFCTALFVVACTAGAEKPSETSTEDGEWGSDADDDGGPGDDEGSSDGLTSAEMSDCVLREIASWDEGRIELDGVEYDDDLICALRVAYTICGDDMGINEECTQ
jgi:hypothetical protein